MPTGTGRIIENVDWFFWDDAEWPGLINFEKFSALANEALSEAERQKFASARVSNRIVSVGESRNRASDDVEKYHQKISHHLAQLRKCDIERLNFWTTYYWRAGQNGVPVDTGLRLLKAYLNVLEYWGYAVRWRDAYDAQGRLRLVVVSKSASKLDRIVRTRQSPFNHVVAPHDQIEYCVHQNDILRIVGRPHQFSMEVAGAMWSFDYNNGRVDITPEA